MGVEISSKERGKQKKREGVLEVALPGTGVNDLPWGRNGLTGGPEVGENYKG